MYSDEHVLSKAVERWRTIMSWTFMFSVKAAVFFGIAIAAAVSGVPDVSPKHLWPVVATYALTGMVLVLAGMLFDARGNAQRPQAIEVLLRHDGKAWLLTVMRNPTGELYAPSNKDKRIAWPILDLRDIPEDVLGCPRFVPCPQGAAYSPRAFQVLGKRYTSLA